jgi:hypothetical protein
MMCAPSISFIQFVMCARSMSFFSSWCMHLIKVLVNIAISFIIWSRISFIVWTAIYLYKCINWSAIYLYRFIRWTAIYFIQAYAICFTCSCNLFHTGFCNLFHTGFRINSWTISASLNMHIYRRSPPDGRKRERRGPTVWGFKSCLKRVGE